MVNTAGLTFETIDQFGSLCSINPISPKGSQHVSSLSSNIAESFIKNMGIKKKILNSRGSDYNMNSPHQYQRNFIVKSLENMDIDVCSL